MSKNITDINILLGFRNVKNSVMTNRTIMVAELEKLLTYNNSSLMDFQQYMDAIINENCLHKATENNKNYTAKHLQNLYGLDPSNLVFRGLKFFYDKESCALPLLASLAAYSRDSIFNISFSYIQNLPIGALSRNDDFILFIEKQYPGRFSDKMLLSLVQNLHSSWTQSGHLTGKMKKIRQNLPDCHTAVCYALFLGSIKGIRGQNLFFSEYVNLLEYGYEKSLELAKESAAQGFINMKCIGDVIEVRFPGIITEKELEQISE